MWTPMAVLPAASSQLTRTQRCAGRGHLGRQPLLAPAANTSQLQMGIVDLSTCLDCPCHTVGEGATTTQASWVVKHCLLLQQMRQICSHMVAYLVRRCSYLASAGPHCGPQHLLGVSRGLCGRGLG